MPENTTNKGTMFTKLSDSAGKWMTILNLVIILVGFVSQYSVNQFKQTVMQKEIDKLDKKVSEVEVKVNSYNPALILKQLQTIQESNTILNEKIEKQSSRIDNVLEILIKK